jgi:hypothetical protein
MFMVKKMMEACGLYYKPITIVNDDSSIINMLETSLTDDAKVIIYDRLYFIVKATSTVFTTLNFHFLPNLRMVPIS